MGVGKISVVIERLPGFLERCRTRLRVRKAPTLAERDVCTSGTGVGRGVRGIEFDSALKRSQGGLGGRGLIALDPRTANQERFVRLGSRLAA